MAYQQETTMTTYVVTTIYNGQRKFLRTDGRHSVAVESKTDADRFTELDEAAEAAFKARQRRRWRGFSWHEAEYHA